MTPLNSDCKVSWPLGAGGRRGRGRAGVAAAGRQQGAPCASRRRPRRAQVITLVVRHLQQPAVVVVPDY